MNKNIFKNLITGLQESLNQENKLLDSLEDNGISINRDRYQDCFWSTVNDILLDEYDTSTVDMIMDFICDGYLTVDKRTIHTTDELWDEVIN